MARNNLHQPADELFVGVDIGGTKIIVQIVDRGGGVVFRRKTGTSSDVKAIADMVRLAVADAGVSEEEIAGCGFGVPGVTDPGRGIVAAAPALQWHNLEFSAQMEALLNKPVTVENDVNCAALGERWLGAARDADDFVFIALGTGVGAAIVSGGRLIRGHSFMAGEIGYMLTAEEEAQEDRQFTFETFGPLEEKISGRALSGRGIPPEAILKQYKERSGEGYEIFSNYLKTLSMAMANIACVLNPQKAVLGGGAAGTIAGALDDLRRRLARLTPVPVAVECSALGEYAGAFGAAAAASALVWQRKFDLSFAYGNIFWGMAIIVLAAIGCAHLYLRERRSDRSGGRIKPDYLARC